MAGLMAPARHVSELTRARYAAGPDTSHVLMRGSPNFHELPSCRKYLST